MLFLKMKVIRPMERSQMRGTMLVLALMTLLSGAMGGCEVDSFFDPSKTGYFEHTPVTMPIIERVDVIERGEEQWAETSSVTPADLVPSDLEYRLIPGDIVTIQVLDLPRVGEVSVWTRRVDQSGNLRLPPPLRDFPAAGLTLAELENTLVDALQPDYLTDPFISANLEEGQGFMYTLFGSVPRPGLYPLRRPDLRLLDALARAGGAFITTDRIYVIRPVPLSEEYEGSLDDRSVPAGERDEAPVDVEDLIDRLDDDGTEDAGDDNGTQGGGNAGVLKYDGEPVIDIDDVQPRRIAAGQPARNRLGSGDVNRDFSATRNDSFVYIEERNEWVRVHRQQEPGQEDDDDITEEMLPGGDGQLVVERVIEIPYKKLLSDSSYNIVVRPSDRIFVEPPLQGVVYVGGEVLRPGVYQLPPMGRLTLSQLVTAAGGPGALAIPERVDLTRRVGNNREATMRVSLAAIRQRNEPDIFLKPDDHIMIGTNWIAAPLAVVRNGFRATYGFGFLLDRNFGNDVFGAPPVNRLN